MALFDVNNGIFILLLIFILGIITGNNVHIDTLHTLYMKMLLNDIFIHYTLGQELSREYS